MSTTDVHRQIDNRLPAGKACTGVTMIEVYTATIDGTQYSVDAPLLNGGYPMSPEAVADLIVAQIGSTENAAPEGGEAEPAQASFFKEPDHAPPLDYDDGSDDDEDWVDDDDAEAAPKKKKAKAKKHR